VELPVPVGRLAPSPTGLLHLGHARSFLLAFWHVRSRGGRLVLRLEDLDGPRVQPEWVSATLRDLSWLGLDWDGPPELQSEHVERIRSAARDLEERGLAYACVCTRGELRALSAPHAGDAEPRYPGTCRHRFTSLPVAEAASGRHAGLRFAVPPGAIAIQDGFAGTSSWDVAADVGDFLILRRDKLPAYQLAVVVDDAAQGVTEVLRGDDLLSSAARQWHLQRALGLPSPAWFHVPLVCDASGRRLAKRSDDLSLSELRARGVDARAVVAWVAASAGMHVPERVSAGEATSEFDLARVPRSPVSLREEDVARLVASR
jgi:glutamyl-tRNA synthetase